MNITSVKVRNLDAEGKMKAIASITIDDCFVVTGIKVMNGSNGLFISMPNRKTPDGEYKDICYPVTKDTRQAIQDMILDEYNKQERGDSYEPSTNICERCGKPVDLCECLPF